MDNLHNAFDRTGLATLTSIGEFTAGLRAIPAQRFEGTIVYNYVRDNPVDEASLRPYLFFSRRGYTRNLIFKNDLFELMALCWDVGQASRIHNHYNQSCWMSMPIGKLRVQNFRVVDEDMQTGYCRIERTEAFDINQLLPAEVDSSEPVHQVVNLPEFNQRAASLHIYSRPFDRCLIYSQSKNRCSEVQLHYTSEYGRLCAGIEV